MHVLALSVALFVLNSIRALESAETAALSGYLPGPSLPGLSAWDKLVCISAEPAGGQVCSWCWVTLVRSSFIHRVGIGQTPISEGAPANRLLCLQILYFTNDKLYKPGSQAERLSLLHDPPTMGDATLQLTNIRASDNGTYICEVNNPPDFYGSGSGLIHFTVLMPPSTPVCKGTEYARIGGDAMLTCSSVEGVPAPIYVWSRVDSKTSLPLANMVQDDQTGKLQLTNLSLAFSGTYQCMASNQFGHASCQVTVNVSGEMSTLFVSVCPPGVLPSAHMAQPLLCNMPAGAESCYARIQWASASKAP
uniref:V-set and immunoglobulin domain containing 2 n=1 Tax=Chrysemys picta bellii TaxID=8478 RepID=A0A8C3HBQ9_CHRPI